MYWDDGWHDRGAGAWWLVFMALMMIAFWAGLAWVIVSVVRHGGRNHDFAAPPRAASVSPEDILHERFARGEIGVDEYQQRVDALRSKHGS